VTKICTAQPPLVRTGKSLRRGASLAAKEWTAHMKYSRIAWRLPDRMGWPQRVTKAWRVAFGAALAMICGSHAALADETPTAPPADPAAPTPTSSTSPPAQTAAPLPPVPAPVAKTVPIAVPSNNPISEKQESSSLPTDHEVVVGAIGLGYIGSYRVPLPLAIPVGRGDQAGMFPNDKMNIRQLLVPTLGLRKWFTKRRGFEAGLGLSLSAGGTSATLGKASTTVDRESVFAMSVHAGVPLMLVDTRHMAFMLIPEATLSFATSNVSAEFEENAPPDARMRGIGIDAGLRAGAEVHFGFMGLPRLTLQAGVGIYLTAQWASATVSNQSLSDRSLSLGFGSAGNPWDIFSGVANMSARYYF